MSAHTPGPWRCRKLEADGTVIRRDGYEITTPDFDVVANIHAGAPIRREADGHLIAAAPDLLAACQKFIDSYKSLQREKCDVAHALAVAAIAKAEGQ